MIHDTYTPQKNANTLANLHVGLATSVLAAVFTAAPTSTSEAATFAKRQDSRFTITHASRSRKDEYDYCEISENGFATSTFASASNVARIGHVDTSVLEQGASIADERLYSYMKTFLTELNRRPEFLSVEKSVAFAIFFRSALKISQLPTEKSTIQLIPDNGFKYIMKLKGNRLLMASQSMEKAHQKNVVYSLFENKRLIEANMTDIDNFKNVFNELVEL